LDHDGNIAVDPWFGGRSFGEFDYLDGLLAASGATKIGSARQLGIGEATVYHDRQIVDEQLVSFL
jgi:hypothetical protein